MTTQLEYRIVALVACYEHYRGTDPERAKRAWVLARELATERGETIADVMRRFNRDEL